MRAGLRLEFHGLPLLTVGRFVLTLEQDPGPRWERVLLLLFGWRARLALDHVRRPDYPGHR